MLPQNVSLGPCYFFICFSLFICSIAHGRLLGDAVVGAMDQIAWDSQQLPNTSYGRTSDGAETWTTFVANTATPPTPNEANDSGSGETCLGDLNGDGAVGVNDVLAVLGEFGCQTSCTADIDGNGTVGVNDVLAVLSEFGVVC